MDKLKTSERLSDMHHSRVLRLVAQKDGDVILTIEQDGLTIGGTELGDPRAEIASVEFCTSPLRSPHTIKALHQLFEAMKLDNSENPICS